MKALVPDLSYKLIFLWLSEWESRLGYGYKLLGIPTPTANTMGERLGLGFILPPPVRFQQLGGRVRSQ